MSRRRFVIRFNEIPVQRALVRAGKNPQDVVTACRCINVGLFISYGLREDVEVQIAYGLSDDLKTITFPGSLLRRVSPDERSISFFLLKACKVLEKLKTRNNLVLSNGIIVERTTLLENIAGWETICIATLNGSKAFSMPVNTNILFFYDLTGQENDLVRFARTKTMYRFSTPERFVLEVNRYFDKRMDALKKCS